MASSASVIQLVEISEKEGKKKPEPLMGQKNDLGGWP